MWMVLEQEIKMYALYTEVRLSQANKVLLKDQFEQVRDIMIYYI